MEYLMKLTGAHPFAIMMILICLGIGTLGCIILNFIASVGGKAGAYFSIAVHLIALLFLLIEFDGLFFFYGPILLISMAVTFKIAYKKHSKR